MSIDFAVLQRGATVRVTLAPSADAAADQERDTVEGTLFLIDEQTQTLVIGTRNSSDLLIATVIQSDFQLQSLLPETFSNTSRKRGYNMIALSAIRYSWSWECCNDSPQS